MSKMTTNLIRICEPLKYRVLLLAVRVRLRAKNKKNAQMSKTLQNNIQNSCNHKRVEQNYSFD